MQTESEYAEFLPEVDVADGLSRLRNNKKIYMTLLKNFKLGQMVDELLASIHEGEYTKIAQAAHAIKGSAANLGFMGLTEITATIEKQAKSNMSCDEFIASLENIAGKTINSINTLLERGMA